jgi:hypothetical protein
MTSADESSLQHVRDVRDCQGCGPTAITDQVEQWATILGKPIDKLLTFVAFVPWLWLALDLSYGTERLYFGRSLIAVYMTDDITQACRLSCSFAKVTRPRPFHDSVALDCLSPLQAIPVSQMEIPRLAGDRRGVGFSASRLASERESYPFGNGS